MRLLTIIFTFLIVLTGCNEETTDSTGSVPVVSISTSNATAYEKDNVFAKFILARDVSGEALLVNYAVSGSKGNSEGSASSEDYHLVYADGGNVGAQLELLDNQISRVIEVQPVDDAEFEVPETLQITLQTSPDYALNNTNEAKVIISDASNDPKNAKVFIGLFGAEGNAVTNATGTLSLILQGDNTSAQISYNFFDLSSEQTDQHIHLSPSGTVIHDIEEKGPLSNLVWDLAPGGIFVTRQDMLDALFSGNLYINIHTTNYPAGEISAFLIYDKDATPPNDIPLSAEDVDRDIIRFLTQATFGPTEKDYKALRNKIRADGENRLQVYEDWIDTQVSLPATSMLQLADASVSKFNSDKGFRDRRDAFWTNAIFGKDQLRQRMAFALSEILVIGDEFFRIRRAYRGVADYWDTLSKNAFSTYRKALGDVSRHAIMGTWLSHLRNKKAEPDAGYFPDENYAREIMQLFGFGLVSRQPNGKIILGNDNLPIETYDNQVIQEMARVFTGLGMSYRSNDAGDMIVNNQFDLDDKANKYQYRWTEPMKFFPQYHDFGKKTLFSENGVPFVIPANSDESVPAADAELDEVLDNIVAHSTTAPNISRLLIQRFVTSNPSPEYIQRVAEAFGRKGNLKAVIKAILLDVEARTPSVSESHAFGKVKEPILRMTSLLRLLGAGSQIPLSKKNNGLNLSFADRYETNASIIRLGDLSPLGQQTLRSPTVFNFFLPDFSPAGALSANSLASPELQLMTESQLFSTMNLFNLLLNNGLVRENILDDVAYTREQLLVTVNYDELNNRWDNVAGDAELKAEAVIDYLDFYLNSGQLKELQSDTRSILIDAVAQENANKRMITAVYGLVNAPEVLVQK